MIDFQMDWEKEAKLGDGSNYFVVWRGMLDRIIDQCFFVGRNFYLFAAQFSFKM